MQHSHCVHFWPVLGMMVLLAGPLSAQSTISKPSGALEDFAQHFVIGEPEAQGAVVVGALGNLARRKLCHQDRNFQSRSPQSHCVLKFCDLKATFLTLEGKQIK